MKSFLSSCAVGVTLLYSLGVAASTSEPFWRSEMMLNADAIVVAVPEREYAPGDTEAPLGPADALERWPLVEFRVLEVVWGRDVPETLVLSGTLVDSSNFNVGPIPYVFSAQRQRTKYVLPDRYARDGRFLLFLGREMDSDGGRSYLTVEHDARTPNSEQLRSEDDPWLAWVRGFLEGAEYMSRYTE